jgi:hypothetical protein
MLQDIVLDLRLSRLISYAILSRITTYPMQHASPPKYKSLPSSPHTSQSRLVIVMYLNNFLSSQISLCYPRRACNRDEAEPAVRNAEYGAKEKRVPQAPSCTRFKPWIQSIGFYAVVGESSVAQILSTQKNEINKKGKRMLIVLLYIKLSTPVISSSLVVKVKQGNMHRRMQYQIDANSE